MAKDTKEKKSLIDKAKSHQVKRQAKKPLTREELEVYVAYMNGEINTTQACFALDCSQSTFRGNSGNAIRDGVLTGMIAEIEFVED